MKTLLVFPPFWVQSLVWILHLNPRPPFCVFFSWLFSFVPGLFAWVDGCVFFFFFLLFLAEDALCMAENGQRGSECSPPFIFFFVWMSTCDVYVTHCVWCDPVSRMVSAQTYGSPFFHAEMAEVFETETAACFSISFADWGGVQIRFYISRSFATYLEHFSSERV